MPVRFKFEFHEGYMSYNENKGGYEEIERIAISAKLHRVLTTMDIMELDELLLPVYIFEKYFCKYKSGYYPNIRKRYYKIDENGNIITFKSIRSFSKSLIADLEKYRNGSYFLKTRIYVSDVPIYLYPLFYPFETDYMLNVIKEIVEDKTLELRDKLRTVRLDIDATNALIRERVERIEKLRNFSVDESANLTELDTKIMELLDIVMSHLDKKTVNKLGNLRKEVSKLTEELEKLKSKFERYNLKELKEKYYPLLEEGRMLSKTKKEIVEFLARTTNQEYKIKERMLAEMMEICVNYIKKLRDTTIQKIENDIARKLENLNKLTKKEIELDRRLKLTGFREYKLLSSEVRKGIIRGNGKCMEMK